MARLGPSLALLVLACELFHPSVVQAHPNDISLRGLGRPRQASFSTREAMLADPAVQRYRALSSELAFAMAPRPLQPADTLGMSGFEFSIATNFTGINGGADYWQGQPGSPVFEGVTTGRNVPRSLWTPSVHVRKGLPMSTEIGVSGTYLAFSEMFMLGTELKIALHESYFRWVPALSGRLAFGRLFGSSDLDIFTGEADLLASLPFGVGGMAKVTPYVGGGLLFSHVNSQVLDETPYLVSDPSDQKGGADGSLYTFPTLEWHANRHTRLFGGVRVNVAMIEILYELNVGLMPFDGVTLFSHSIKFGFDV